MKYREGALRFTVLLTLLALSHAADPALNLCPLNPDEKVGVSSITWAQVLAKPIKDFEGISYLRPDVGKSSEGLVRFDF